MKTALSLACALYVPAVAAIEPRDAPLAPAHTAAMETVVVSATRTRRPQFSTPAAISVIDRESIELTQPYGYQDIFDTLPSVNIQGGPRRIAEEPAIRGFSDEQVAIRVDGTRLNYNKAHGGRFLLDPSLIESVEVLRGAGSATFGSGALGGVFLIETANGRDLSGDADGAGLRVSSGYQSNGDEIRGSATGYASAGKLDALAHLTLRQTGEDLVDGNGDDILATEDETGNALLKLGFEPDHQRIELALEQFENSGRNPVNANDFASTGNLVDRSTERRNTRLRYQINPPAQDWLNLSVVAYENRVDAREFRLDDSRLDRSTFRTRGIEVINSMEFPVAAGDAIRITGGLEAYEDTQSGTRNGAARRQFPDAEVSYGAGFLQAEIPLPAGFSLIPGLRYDAFEYSASDNFTARSDNEVTPRLALGWQPAESLYLWMEYAEAFRAPSLGELFADGVHFIVPLGPGQVVINEFVPTPELRAEQSEQWQAGGRWQQDRLFSTDLSMTLEASVWRSDVDNFVDQVVTFISGPPRFDPFSGSLVFPGITTNQNVDARLQGAELSVSLQHAAWYVNAGLTVIDGERGSGEDLASVQPNRATIGGGLRLLNGTLTLGADLVLSSDRRDVPEGALATDGYGKADAYARYRPTAGMLAPWEFRIAIDNLFDNAFRVHPNAIEQPGRSVRLAVSRDFSWLP